MDNQIVIKNNRSNGIRRTVCGTTSVLIACNPALIRGVKGNTVGETVLHFCIYIIAGLAILALVYLLLYSRIVIREDCIIIYKGLIGKKIYYSKISRCFMRNRILTLYGGRMETVIDLSEYDSSYDLLECLKNKGIAIEDITIGEHKGK